RPPQQGDRRDDLSAAPYPPGDQRHDWGADFLRAKIRAVAGEREKAAPDGDHLWLEQHRAQLLVFDPHWPGRGGSDGVNESNQRLQPTTDGETAPEPASSRDSPENAGYHALLPDPGHDARQWRSAAASLENQQGRDRLDLAGRTDRRGDRER